MRDDENDKRDDRSWRNNDSGNSAHKLEEAQSLLEGAKYGDGKTPNIVVEVDKETGKSQVMGFSVSRNVATIARTLIANVVPWLSRSGGETAYNLAFKAAKGNSNAALYAKIAENALRWGVIGASPITNLIYASRLHARDRKELFEEFAPVMSATKASAKTNEVIRVAFDDLHDDIMMDLKLIAADVPTLLPQVLVGVRDQKAFYENKKQSVVQAHIANAGLETRKDALAKEFAERDELREHLREKNPDISDERIETALDYEMERRERAITAQHENVSKDEGLKQKDQWLVLGGSLVSEVVKDTIHERADKRRNKANAWKMIKHLKREMEEQNAKPADQYSSVAARSPDEIMIDDVSLKDYIIAIFQQHERNRAKLSGEKIAKADSLNPLGPALVERMMPAIDLIAEHIADGRLDPDALVNLVGENKVVIHQPNGARTFAKADDVRKTLDELLAVMSTREAIKPEEFFADFADPALIQNTLKQNLESMQGIEKAYFVSLFPNDILEQAGMSKKEINAQRKMAHRNVYDIVAASVLDIAKKDPDHLKKLGLSEQQITMVSDLAQSIESGDKLALERAVDGRDKKTILGAVRTIGLHEQTSNADDGKAYWAKRVQEADTAKKIVEQGAAKRPTEEGPTPLMDRANREEPLVPGGRGA